MMLIEKGTRDQEFLRPGEAFLRRQARRTTRPRHSHVNALILGKETIKKKKTRNASFDPTRPTSSPLPTHNPPRIRFGHLSLPTLHRPPARSLARALALARRRRPELPIRASSSLLRRSVVVGRVKPGVLTFVTFLALWNSRCSRFLGLQGEVLFDRSLLGFRFGACSFVCSGGFKIRSRPVMLRDCRCSFCFTFVLFVGFVVMPSGGVAMCFELRFSALALFEIYDDMGVCGRLWGNLYACPVALGICPGLERIGLEERRWFFVGWYRKFEIFCCNYMHLLPTNPTSTQWGLVYEMLVESAVIKCSVLRGNQGDFIQMYPFFSFSMLCFLGSGVLIFSFYCLLFSCAFISITSSIQLVSCLARTLSLLCLFDCRAVSEAI